MKIRLGMRVRFYDGRRYQVVSFDNATVQVRLLAYRASIGGRMEWRIEDVEDKPETWLRKNFEACFQADEEGGTR